MRLIILIIEFRKYPCLFLHRDDISVFISIKIYISQRIRMLFILRIIFIPFFYCKLDQENNVLLLNKLFEYLFHRY